MSEYIDKTEAMRRFMDLGREIPKEQVMAVLASIKEGVVRCKDCKWATEARMKSIDGDVIVLKTCPSRTEVIEDGDFCSYGERNE